ncbi:aldehyde dehydrogenase (NADP(+)) [Promicromonospora sukumoe]|uniref:NADP-dependent aldehyde dehydrogenase n=1 Tax=Promicromonospora sukumoe TaxID=88382 RepID=A0A7W3J7J2_9MICO|nr:aldehyde dehydrogenase family protein [Promicromonospora sukumoe]MBA8807579.1 NADP-dependent aldehyde dehydrogenase [Promicromonospora sukumoe]
MDVTSPVRSRDARTGAVRDLDVVETTPESLDDVARRAATAAPDLAAWPRERRAALLEALADALDADRDALVAEADRETALGPDRLGGELTRTAYQLRTFARVVLDGGYLEATIDHAGDTPMGPRPDLRRMLVPLGPVAVYAASNFPFAFSVLGGDTASALAAGNPVVVKAHPGHPATSERVARLAERAVAATGAPAGTFALVHGFDAGVALVSHPAIRAAGFTGSLAGGRALADAAAARPAPIPFYGELSSINPVLVTPSAAREKADVYGAGLAGSVLQGGGQFCTKPGLVLVPAGADGDRVVEAFGRAIGAAPALPALTAGMADAYERGLTARAAEAVVRARGVDPGAGTGGAGAAGSETAGSGTAGSAASTTRPALLEVDAGALTADLVEECFGPLAVVVRYAAEAEAVGVVGQVEGSLTASILTAGATDLDLPDARAALAARAGRVLYDGYPTGVAVAWAQHHGGPWPSTNTLHTSVGATAIRRFLRPLAWQQAPEHALPPELRDGAPVVPVRIDGELVLPTA